MFDKKEKFSIRKFTQGAFSVLIGSSFVMNVVPVNAQAGTTSATVSDDIDSGDAPISYGEATHKIVDGLYTGKVAPDGFKDADTTDWYADDNDVDGVRTDSDNKDEDSVQLLVNYTVDDGEKFTMPVYYTNNVGEAYINAWVDLNRDGQFTDDESVVYENGGVGDPLRLDEGTELVYELTFKGRHLVRDGQPYGTRVRVSQNKDEIRTPSGHAESGEVEDTEIQTAEEKVYYNLTGKKVEAEVIAGSSITIPLEFVAGTKDASEFISNTAILTSDNRLSNVENLKEGSFRISDDNKFITFRPAIDYVGPVPTIRVLADAHIDELDVSSTRSSTDGTHSKLDDFAADNGHMEIRLNVVIRADMSARYEFVNKEDGEPLPAGLNALLPNTQTDLRPGTKIYPEMPRQTEFVDENGIKWLFERYREEYLVLSGTNGVHEGIWYKAPGQEADYGVTYRFDVEPGSIGFSLDLVRDRLPVDNNRYADGQVVRAKDIDTSDWLEPNSINDKYPEGQLFEFVGWRQSEITIQGQDIEFVGTWRAKPMGYFDVIYNFVKSATVPVGVEFPEEVLKLKPVTKEDQPDMSSHLGPVINPRTVNDDVNDGVWTFRGWGFRGSRRISMADIVMNGTWDFTPNYRQVNYEFKLITPEGEVGQDAMPVELIRLLPTAEGNKTTGQVVEPSISGFDSMVIGDKTYEFKGWSENQHTINKADHTFVGTWELKSEKKYNVRYRFKAENETSYLPGSIIERIPTDNRTFADGESVSPIDTFDGSPYLEPNSVSGIYPEGQYFDFVGWETPTQNVNGQDVEFVGIWRMRPMGYFNVIYKFVNRSNYGYSHLELPQAVMDELPPMKTNQPDRSYHVLPRPANRTVADEENDGKWTFLYWDIRGSGRSIQMKDLTFTGTWSFQPNLHTVFREFIIENAGQLNVPEKPATMDDLLPPEFEGEKGEIDREESTFEDIIVDNGKFVFKGWRIKGGDGSFVNELTIDKKDEAFEGVWEFEANKYEVTHSFESATPDKTIPTHLLDVYKDIKFTDLTNGTIQTPTDRITNDTELADFENDGVWQFVGWDKPNVTINNSNENFIGKFEFKANTYNVTHEFISANETPLSTKVLEKLANSDISNLKNNQAVSPNASISLTDVRDDELNGVWRFVEWDSPRLIISKDNGKFVGKWLFTPNESETQELGSVRVRYENEEGIEIRPEVINRNGVVVNRIHTSGTNTTTTPTNETYNLNENFETHIRHNDKEYVFSHVKDGVDLIGTIPVGDTTITFIYREMKYTTEEQRGTIEVLFVDELGTEIKDSVLLKDNVLVRTITTDEDSHVVKEELTDETYDVNEVKEDTIDFENYTYKFLEAQDGPLAENGVVPTGNNLIVLVYKVEPKVSEVENKGTVIVRYEDENGTEIKNEVLAQESVVEKITTTVIPTGENTNTERFDVDYDTNNHKLDTISFENFEYKFSVVKENNEIGQITADNKDVVVTYVYKVVPKTSERVETGEVVVKYVAEDGTTIKDDVFNNKDVITKRYKVSTTPYETTEELVEEFNETYNLSENRLVEIEFNGKKYKLKEDDTVATTGNIITGRTEITLVYKLVEDTNKDTDDKVITPADEPSTPVDEVDNPTNDNKDIVVEKEVISDNTPKHNIPKTNDSIISTIMLGLSSLAGLGLLNRKKKEK